MSIDLNTWLAGATVTQASVDIYQRPDLLGKIEEWQRRYARAEKNAPAVLERGIDDPDPLADLTAEGERLFAELEASKAVWYVRALSSDDSDAIDEAHPEPTRPASFDEAPPVMQAKPTEAQSSAFLAAYEAWKERRAAFVEAQSVERDEYVRAMTRVLKARGAERIVRCLDRIEVGGEVVTGSITIEQARSLPERIGEHQVGKIMEAIGQATNAEPDLPASFSRASSETTPA